MPVSSSRVKVSFVLSSLRFFWKEMERSDSSLRISFNLLRFSSFSANPFLSKSRIIFSSTGDSLRRKEVSYRSKTIGYRYFNTMLTNKLNSGIITESKQNEQINNKQNQKLITDAYIAFVPHLSYPFAIGYRGNGREYCTLLHASPVQHGRHQVSVCSQVLIHYYLQCVTTSP